MIQKWIIYQDEQTSIDLINQINICEGFPTETTLTYIDEPQVFYTKDTMDLIGYGVPVFNWIMRCLTQEQIESIQIIDINDYNTGIEEEEI